MEERIIICPRCNKETRLVTKEEDMHSYQSEIIYQRCDGHTPSPEERLLDALFGGRQ